MKERRTLNNWSLQQITWKSISWFECYYLDEAEDIHKHTNIVSYDLHFLKKLEKKVQKLIMIHLSTLIRVRQNSVHRGKPRIRISARDRLLWPRYSCISSVIPGNRWNRLRRSPPHPSSQSSFHVTLWAYTLVYRRWSLERLCWE